MTLPLALLLLFQPQDPLVQKGFDHFYNLEYQQAVSAFEKAIEAEPGDPNRQNHLAQAVLFGMMFRAGALESQLVTGNNPFLRRAKMEPTATERAAFDSAIARSMQISDAELAKNPNNASALYAKGVALGIRGTNAFLVRRAWTDALKDLTEARKLHNRVSEIDPANYDARMMQGVHDYIVGSLPWHYQMLGFLAGFRGDKEQGIKTLQLVSAKGNYNKTDAQILLGVVYRRESRPADVLPILEELLKRYPRNYLLLFEQAQMYADLGEKDKALASLERVEQLKKEGWPGFQALPQQRIDLARGTLLFWYADFPRAKSSLEKATTGADVLDPANASQAWLRLGESYDLLQQREQAVRAYRLAEKAAPQSDSAKEARRYVSRPFRFADMPPTTPKPVTPLAKGAM